MNPKEKYELITKNLQEVIGEKELEKKLRSRKEFSVYWGTAITSSISIAYFFPMLKVADLLKADTKVKILFADLHGSLDGTSWNDLEKRYNYYKEAITTILKTLNVPLKKLTFIKGSSFQLTKEYSSDLLKLSTFASFHDAKKASSEVVKQSDSPKLSGLIYPLMQSLDEEYLKVDAQLGGNDQRKIMVFARENLPKLGYERRIELLNPIIRGLVGEKMSSSEPSSKIDLMDSAVDVAKKIKKADCAPKETDNGIMALLKYLIFVIKENNSDKFKISRPDKFGGDVEYENYAEFEKDFVSGNIHPLDIKNALTEEINLLLRNFSENKKLVKLFEEAYNG
jgi:tyrosyl-tRNA synthetase